MKRQHQIDAAFSQESCVYLLELELELELLEDESVIFFELSEP